jgi:hypothetical protein
MKGFPHETPNPSSVTVRTNDAEVIPLSPTEVTLVTAPAIKGGDVPKHIHFSCLLQWTGAEVVIFNVYRDGALFLDTTDLFSHDAGAAVFQTVSFHFVDATPGKGEPVYDIRAQGSVGAITTATNRRLTITNQ